MGKILKIRQLGRQYYYFLLARPPRTQAPWKLGASASSVMMRLGSRANGCLQCQASWGTETRNTRKQQPQHTSRDKKTRAHTCMNDGTELGAGHQIKQSRGRNEDCLEDVRPPLSGRPRHGAEGSWDGTAGAYLIQTHEISRHARCLDGFHPVTGRNELTNTALPRW